MTNRRTHSIEEIKAIATNVYQNFSYSGRWPDCYTISNEIIDALAIKLNIDIGLLDIYECFPKSHYHHYVVEVSEQVTGESIIIDGSFEQFAYESDTPLSVAPQEQLEPVVFAHPKENYIFFDTPPK